jgi:hypothetical protein
MGIGPFSSYTIPGLYGLTHYTISKLEDQYKIDYYSTCYQGTPQDIAKQLIKYLSIDPQYGANDNYGGGSPFKVIMKPKLHIMFRANVNAPKDESLEEIAVKINDALVKYHDLIAFL